MFIGRSKELKKLNKMYESNSFEFAVIYGRRRVGKTTLIKEFCKDKKVIYHISREASDFFNLEKFSKDVFDITLHQTSGSAKFLNWEDAFDYIYNIAKDERIILVIDEYPYLAQSNRSISSILQAHIDMKLKESKLFLILCGSSMSFMEYQVLGYKSPLYGRRTAQFKIKPFLFFESIQYHKNFTKEEKAIIYGITSGIPEYLSKIDDNISLKDNIIDLFLDDTGHLFEEPSSLLKQELREPSTYNTIITSIAKGASKLNEISTKSGLESNKCAKYLASLISLGIVRKEKPINEDTSKRSIYVIEDNMFKFWYRFIPDNMTSIVSGNPKKLYEKIIEPQISHYMGAIFEEICKEYLLLKNAIDELPFMFSKIGRWWGGNQILKKQEEIDIMAIGENNSVIYGECKWTKELIDKRVLENTLRRGELFQYKDKYYYLFSKNGFTQDCFNKSSTNIKLIEFDNMFEI
jgi:AAA+ ATPase superfamily predicted ATPase